ncbi:Gfo/Idh/MocA family oxidoreductase [Patescibacteria group bacterium]|nr:Gfo/Idh/MocA family oxidoreductase [Patescibacteria group bacterium]
MKVLIIGCGSIGRRHALNARQLGAEVVLCDINKKRLEEFAHEQQLTSYFLDYNEAIEKTKPEAAVIATPSNFHLQPAMDLALGDIHIFMEKPLSYSLEKIDDLEKAIKDHNITFMMAQSYRFHEGFIALKKMLDDELIGRIYHVEMAGGWYLPDWHFREDYRKEYAAQKALGGGVLLTSMSHTFDTIRWLFGEIEDINGWKAKLSNLDIDVEDYVSCNIKTSNDVYINVVDDFLSRLPRGEMRVFGTEGFISTNFRENTIRYWKVSEKRFLPDDPRILDRGNDFIKVVEDGIMYDPSLSVLNYNFENNRRYIEELKYFFQMIEQGAKQFDLDISAGKKVLELIFNKNINRTGIN